MALTPRSPFLNIVLMVVTIAVTALITFSLVRRPMEEPRAETTPMALTEPAPGGNAQFPSFPSTLSSAFPRNIDQGFYDSLHLDSLARNGLYTTHPFALGKRLMDIYSWQLFISLNWPVDEERTLLFSADTSLANSLDCPDFFLTLVCPFPEAWRRQFDEHNVAVADSVVTKIVEESAVWEVFNADDYIHPFLIQRNDSVLEVYSRRLPKSSISDEGTPFWMTWKESVDVFKPEGSAPSDWYAAEEWPASLPDSIRRLHDPKAKDALFTTHKAGILDEHDEPGANIPLWDQNGNMVYYEIRVNRSLFDDIVNNTLYNLEGQIDFARQFDGDTASVNFAWGNSDADRPFAVGATEVKLAWKILDESNGDIPERFFRKQALVKSAKGEWEEHEMGLVGFHVAHKTKTHMSWIWSTFEHIDNVQVDDLSLVESQNAIVPLKPLFYDPDCATCPVNVEPAADQDGRLRTQVHRMISITEATSNLNWEVRGLLDAADSPLRYYQLVGTQWPTAGHEDRGPITPVNMVNAVMETYYQQGNQRVSLPDGGARLEFRTQSCLNCHGFAKLAVGCSVQNDSVTVLYSKKPQSADYSWLLQKAQWQRRPDQANAPC